MLITQIKAYLPPLSLLLRAGQAMLDRASAPVMPSDLGWAVNNTHAMAPYLVVAVFQTLLLAYGGYKGWGRPRD